MRRSDREIKSFEEILDILNRCNTIRVGFSREDLAYVVPLSFGYEVKDGKILIYYHCSQIGEKNQILEKNKKVCVEADIFHGIMETANGITTLYESIIGFGKCEEVETVEERKHGLSMILKYYKKDDYPLDRCKGIEQAKVFRIILDSVTGKRNRMEDKHY